MDQTLTTRYVSRFEPLALHPCLHTVKDFQSNISHRGNLYRRGFVTTQGVPNSSLNTNTTSHKRGRPVAKQQPTPLPKRVTTTKLHLTQEGANHRPQPLPKRDTTKARVYNLEATTTSNNLSFHFFHKTMILIE